MACSVCAVSILVTYAYLSICKERHYVEDLALNFIYIASQDCKWPMTKTSKHTHKFYILMDQLSLLSIFSLFTHVSCRQQSSSWFEEDLKFTLPSTPLEEISCMQLDINVLTALLKKRKQLLQRIEKVQERQTPVGFPGCVNCQFPKKYFTLTHSNQDVIGALFILYDYHISGFQGWFSFDHNKQCKKPIFVNTKTYLIQ